MILHKNLRILVVDDFATMRRIIRKMLTDIGLTNIVDADDGTRAWDILERDQIEFVISDWTMPTMSGIELLKKVRADERFKNLPFLMVTAEANKEYVIEACKHGVSNYVVKPFTEQVLLQKIAKIFKMDDDALKRTDGDIIRM